MAEAEKVLAALALPVTLDRALVGGAAYAATGHPLPPETLAKAKAADALLFGAVGDPRFDNVERHLRPEQAILGLRAELGLFANLRPAKLFAGLEDKLRYGETTLMLQFPVWQAYAPSFAASVVAAIVAVYCAVARVLGLMGLPSGLGPRTEADH